MKNWTKSTIEMIRTVMAKLDTLDEIKNRIVCVEQDFKQMKSSLEFAHAEVEDLKKQIENAKNSEEENRNRTVELEEANRCLHARERHRSESSIHAR
jgi:predicted nuclease with TOPRIM domain